MIYRNNLMNVSICLIDVFDECICTSLLKLFVLKSGGNMKKTIDICSEEHMKAIEVLYLFLSSFYLPLKVAFQSLILIYIWWLMPKNLGLLICRQPQQIKKLLSSYDTDIGRAFLFCSCIQKRCTASSQPPKQMGNSTQ